jgi:UDP-N-acetylmuramyl pentapeptide phosphotransferase/UDP-N-acetylglucosamine-1-phosphate transferase
MTAIDALPVAVRLGALAVLSATVCALLIRVLRPLLMQYALVRPSSRSSHVVPTPQGGGIAVIAATTTAVACASMITPEYLGDSTRLSIVFASTIGLTVVGAIDDIRPMGALSRLALQTAAVIVLVASLPAELRVLPALPFWLERLLVVIASVWFVNLVNFMDGIDWITVAEVVPLTVGLVLFGLLGALPNIGIAVALALCGATIGFAPFNRPVARLFLGDVGSLPIGLLLTWLLVLLSGSGHVTAALLLPLYYLADSTITLLRRFINGEDIMQPHRSHFYQRAAQGGKSVYAIIGCIFAVNIGLVALATIAVLAESLLVEMGVFTIGAALVSALLWNFNRSDTA